MLAEEDADAEAEPLALAELEAEALAEALADDEGLELEADADDDSESEPLPRDPQPARAVRESRAMEPVAASFLGNMVGSCRVSKGSALGTATAGRGAWRPSQQ